MPTPMRVFGEIAARYGVNRRDEDAVDQFFDETLRQRSPREQQFIFDELLGRDGEPDEMTFEEKLHHLPYHLWFRFRLFFARCIRTG